MGQAACVRGGGKTVVEKSRMREVENASRGEVENVSSRECEKARMQEGENARRGGLTGIFRVGLQEDGGIRENTYFCVFFEILL